MVKLTKGELARQIISDVRYSTTGYERFTLKYLVEQYGEDAEIVFDDDGGYGDYDSYMMLEIRVNREETNEEYEARLTALRKSKQKIADQQKAVKTARDAKERAEYERLRKKFERSVKTAD